MTNKIEINIVYAPSTGEPSIIFENEKGRIWNSNRYDTNKINIGMGWYSIRDPNPQDSILVVEPYCVLERDYDVEFTKKFKYIFTWATKAMENPEIKDKVVAINHPTYHDFPDPSTNFSSWPSWNERNNEIVIIANNKSSQHHSELYSLRMYLADVLDAYSSFEVSWYGQIPINRKYFKGKVGDKESILKRAKFSICTENSYDSIYTHNYFTEKMPDVWLAGTVPIYMGCFNINDFGFFNESYIDLRPLVVKHNRSWNINKRALNDQIIHYSEDQYNQYIEKLKNNIILPGKLQEHHSYKNVYETIINKFLHE